MTKATDLITAERERQISAEGYTPDHDLGRAHALVDAAKCYLRAGSQKPGTVPIGWPWADHYWKPTGDPVRDLTKAGALIAAAIDSLAGPVHNHGPAEGRGLDCGERRMPNGLLRGWCLEPASDNTDTE